MLPISKVDHVGIRVSNKQAAVDFYAMLGFKLIADVGFDKGHPVIMEHPGGVVINLLGTSNKDVGTNILMDVEDKYSGITHVALRVDSLEDTETFLEEKQIAITGRFTFNELSAVFIRDPDRNVIELDYRDVNNKNSNDNNMDGYSNHE